MRLAIFALLASSCFGQLRSVEIRVSGLDCASCAGSVEPRLKRVRGVAAAKFDAERGIAKVEMAPENKVTLGGIRDALKGLGYTPGDADVVVSGTVTQDRLSLPHQADAFLLDKQNGASGKVKVEGSVPAGTDTLRVRTLQPD